MLQFDPDVFDLVDALPEFLERAAKRIAIAEVSGQGECRNELSSSLWIAAAAARRARVELQAAEARSFDPRPRPGAEIPQTPV